MDSEREFQNVQDETYNPTDLAETEGFQSSPFRYAPAPDGCEDLEKYCAGGYLPVLIGDTFENDRYRVVHKLGSGGTATVWLARDAQSQQLVAMKFLTAESSTRTRELRMHQLLQASRLKAVLEERVATLLDHFWVSGPCQSHLCLIFEVLGPCLASLNKYKEERKITPEKQRVLASQIIEGILHLHKAGVILADVSAYNMLFAIEGIHSWTDDQLYRMFGQPEEMPVYWDRQNRDEEWKQVGKNDAYAPEYVYRPINFLQTAPHLLQPQLKFIDLGEAFEIASPPQAHEIGLNVAYSAPELAFDAEPTANIDIWGLACCLFELRSGDKLFDVELGGAAGVFDQMVDALGPAPEEWLHAMYPELENDEVRILSEEEAQQRGINIQPGITLKQRLADIGRLKAWHFMNMEQRLKRFYEFFGDDADPEEVGVQLDVFARPPARLSPSEKRQFHDLLTRMLNYKPEERLSIQEVLFHPWVKREVKAKKSRAWLQRYDPGRDFSERWRIFTVPNETG